MLLMKKLTADLKRNRIKEENSSESEAKKTEVTDRKRWRSCWNCEASIKLRVSMIRI
ncbi:hypothetical protein Hanom_Chr17g01567031 [Helianthus anomalus]